MNLQTLLKPPGAPPHGPSDLDAHPRRSPALTRERAHRYGRVASIGIILSVLIHILLLWVSPLVVRYTEPGVFSPVRPSAVTAEDDAMRVVELFVTETPRVEPRPVDRQREPNEPVVADTEGDAEPTLTAAERLRPRVGDWRLWVVSPIARRARTPAEETAGVNARLHAILEAYDDSMIAALERQAEAMDWTVGEEGNKWGVSPGKIHLGPITLPLPFSFDAFAPTARDQADQAAEWGAIRRQAGEGAIDESFDERVKAIRERKEQERADEKAKADSTSNR